MNAPFVCTRCRLREAGTHGCQDRACHCCYGESPAEPHVKALAALHPVLRRDGNDVGPDRLSCLEVDARAGGGVNSEAHAIPPGDTFDHEVTGDCPCGPLEQPFGRADGPDGLLFLHHPLAFRGAWQDATTGTEG